MYGAQFALYAKAKRSKVSLELLMRLQSIEKEYRGVKEKKSRHISQMSFTSSLPLESYIRTALSAGGRERCMVVYDLLGIG